MRRIISEVNYSVSCEVATWRTAYQWCQRPLLQQIVLPVYEVHRWTTFQLEIHVEISLIAIFSLFYQFFDYAYII